MSTENRNETENALEPLATKINSGHKKCLKSLRSSLKHAREVGTALLEAKEQIQAANESWRKWVQEQCDCSLSEAGRYMRIADRYNELRQSSEDLSKLTVTQALKLLSTGQKVARKSLQLIKVSSAAVVERLVSQAAEVRFADDSAEKKFLAATVAGIVRQVVTTAGKSKLTDEQQQPLSPAEVAVALLEHLKKALTVEKVIEVEEPTPPATPVAPASSPTPNQPHAPRNRLHGGHKKNGATATV